MKPLKLYVKVTLLTIAIMVTTLGIAVVPLIKKISNVIILEKKQKVELAAVSLATETGQSEQPRNDNIDRVSREAKIVKNIRYNFTLVRVYRLTENSLVEEAAAEGSKPSQAFTQEEITAIKRREAIHQDIKTEANYFRVVVPIIGRNKETKVIEVMGAIEIVSTLDDSLKTIQDITNYLLILVTLAMVITLISFYLVMNSWIYKPIANLLLAMQNTQSGNLSLVVEVRAPDEIGLLTSKFNQMISQLKTMSKEREEYQQHLAEEIARTTRELWRLSRYSSELERLAAVGQTAAQFAHEVGTPLHIINGHIKLLRTKFSPDEKASQKLAIVIEQVKRIETIVRTMLDSTRITKLQKEEIQINTLVEKICQTIAPNVEEKGLKLEVVLAKDLPIVSANKEKLEQALLNLLNNALDATTSGKIKVITSYEAISDELIIEVEDTGSGISQDIAKRIFDPLYTTKEIGKGTGLGLVIVQQVAHQHNGRVDFDTEEGRGTSFRLRLPVAISKEAIAVAK